MIPPIHIRDNLQLKPGGYAILVKGVEVARGELMVGYHLALHPGETLREIEGIPTREPTFNLPALWIPASRREEALRLGYTVVNPASVVATHLSEIIRSHCDELLGRQEVQKLMDRLARTHPKVVEELTPGVLPLGVIQKVLQNLVREWVSIRDVLTVMETLADYGAYSKDPDILTEYVRQRLGRALTKALETADGKIMVYTRDPFIEDLLNDSLQKSDYGAYLAMAPDTAPMRNLLIIGLFLIVRPIYLAVVRTYSPLSHRMHLVVMINSVDKTIIVLPAPVLKFHGSSR